MSRKPTRKPKLTDAERHARFVEVARKVGASENPKDFDKAFKKVVLSEPRVVSDTQHRSKHRKEEGRSRR